MSHLAVVVEKERTGDAVDELRESGAYDDSRRVRSHDAEHTEVPVIERPAGDWHVVEQGDPEYRVSGLDDHLRQRGWTDEEIGNAPSSWAVVGDVVLVRFPAECPRREEVAEALLDLQGADTVLARRGIEGEHREPDVEVVAGSGDTETVHAEHGTRYALDLARVMFSPGNKAERVRMGDVVSEGERVFDMFAGIGYFSLPMARAGAQVTAAERNPEAFRFLVENAALNDVTDRLRPFRADCRDVTEWSRDPDTEVDATAERIVMGYYDAHEYLDAALDVLEPGGVVHLHEATPEAELWNRPVSRLEAACDAADRGVEILQRRRVKTHAEGVSHVVLDARAD